MEIDAYARLFKRVLREFFSIESRVTSTFRSREKQTYLYRTRSSRPAAPPGRSTHEYGLAFDLVTKDPGAQHFAGELWEALGFYWGGRFGDTIHFQVIDPPTFQEWLARMA